MEGPTSPGIRQLGCHTGLEGGTCTIRDWPIGSTGNKELFGIDALVTQNFVREGHLPQLGLHEAMIFATHNSPKCNIVMSDMRCGCLNYWPRHLGISRRRQLLPDRLAQRLCALFGVIGLERQCHCSPYLW